MKADGDCFVVAGREILTQSDDSGFFLCHGTATGRGKIAGIPFAHAWLEVGDTVIDISNGLDVAMRRDEYYELGDVRNVVRYTPAEARRLMLKHETFGPWTPRPTAPLDAMMKGQKI